MSLAIKYENVADAQMRLRHTVVLYKGEPVLIADVAPGEGKDDILRVSIQNLPSVKINVGGFGDAPRPRVGRIVLEEAEVKRKYISSKHFDIAPFRMGYVNSKEGAFYCTRMPNRVQKQGLCAENFSAKFNNGTPVNFRTFLACPETPLMVAGKYPSFDLSVRSLDKVPSVAFHWDFCLIKDSVISDLIYVYYKGEKVGMYTGGSKTISLGKKFKCLKESLVELGLKVGEC